MDRDQIFVLALCDGAKRENYIIFKLYREIERDRQRQTETDRDRQRQRDIYLQGNSDNATLLLDPPSSVALSLREVLMSGSEKTSMMRNATWALSNLCRGLVRHESKKLFWGWGKLFSLHQNAAKGGVWSRGAVSPHQHRQKRQNRQNRQKCAEMPVSLGPLSAVIGGRVGFGEPMFCTLNSRGFRHFRAFRDFCESSNRPPCLWLSELSSSFACFPSFS